MHEDEELIDGEEMGQRCPIAPQELRKANKNNRGYQVIVSKSARRIGGERSLYAFVVVVSTYEMYLLDGRGMDNMGRIHSANLFLEDFYPNHRIAYGTQKIYYAVENKK